MTTMSHAFKTEVDNTTVGVPSFLSRHIDALCPPTKDEDDWMEQELERARQQRGMFYRKLANTRSGSARETEDLAGRPRGATSRSSTERELSASPSGSNTSPPPALPEPHSSWKFYTSFDNGEWKRHCVPVNKSEDELLLRSPTLDGNKEMTPAYESHLKKYREARASLFERGGARRTPVVAANRGDDETNTVRIVSRGDCDFAALGKEFLSRGKDDTSGGIGSRGDFGSRAKNFEYSAKEGGSSARLPFGKSTTEARVGGFREAVQDGDGNVSTAFPKKYREEIVTSETITSVKDGNKPAVTTTTAKQQVPLVRNPTQPKSLNMGFKEKIITPTKFKSESERAEITAAAAERADREKEMASASAKIAKKSEIWENGKPTFLGSTFEKFNYGDVPLIKPEFAQSSKPAFENSVSRKSNYEATRLITEGDIEREMNREKPRFGDTGLPNRGKPVFGGAGAVNQTASPVQIVHTINVTQSSSERPKMSDSKIEYQHNPEAPLSSSMLNNNERVDGSSAKDDGSFETFSFDRSSGAKLIPVKVVIVSQDKPTMALKLSSAPNAQISEERSPGIGVSEFSAFSVPNKTRASATNVKENAEDLAGAKTIMESGKERVSTIPVVQLQDDTDSGSVDSQVLQTARSTDQAKPSAVKNDQHGRILQLEESTEHDENGKSSEYVSSSVPVFRSKGVESSQTSRVNVKLDADEIVSAGVSQILNNTHTISTSPTNTGPKSANSSVIDSSKAGHFLDSKTGIEFVNVGVKTPPSVAEASTSSSAAVRTRQKFDYFPQRTDEDIEKIPEPVTVKIAASGAVDLSKLQHKDDSNAATGRESLINKHPFAAETRDVSEIGEVPEQWKRRENIVVSSRDGNAVNEEESLIVTGEGGWVIEKAVEF